MKRINLIFAMTAALFVAASCQKEELDIDENGNLRSFTGYGERMAQEDGDTKTYIDWFEDSGVLTRLDFVWSKDDQIAVYSGTSTTKKTFSNNSSDGEKASFSGEGTPVASMYYSVYPANLVTSRAADGKISASLKPVQVVTKGGVDMEALLSFSASDNAVLQFKNLFGLLVFEVDDENTTSVTIQGNNNEILSGPVTISTSGVGIGGMPTISKDSQNGCKFVNIKASQDGQTKFAKGYYAATILPGTFEQGFKLIFTHSDGIKTARKTTATNCTLARNGAFDIRKLTTALKDEETPDNTDYKYYYITSKADLVAWNNDSDNWTANDMVILGADIDYGDTQLFKSTATFLGTFDGQYHRIYNYFTTSDNRRSGVFDNVKGTVKNVCFGSADYDFSTGVGNYDKNSVSRITSGAASADNWYYAGPIAYLHEGGTIENVVNFSSVLIKFTSGNNYKSRAGGIAGTMKANATITNCKNYGSVTNSSTVSSTQENLQIGGIVSINDGAGCTLTNCVNYGEVKSTSKFITSVGGIIGSVDFDFTDNTISDCANYGNVEFDSTDGCTYDVKVGGIAGWVRSRENTNSVTFSNCTNSGTVKNTSNLSTDKNAIVGGIVGQNNRACTISGCSNTYVNDTKTGAISNSGSTNITNIGGLVGRAESQIIIGSSSSNSGSVTNTGAASSYASCGGIVSGVNGADSSIDGVTNSGNVSNTYASSMTGSYLGGIVGWNGKSCTISDSSSSGNVTNFCPATTIFMGGIIGSVENQLTVSSVSVTGNATIKNDVACGALHIGGIAGKLSSSTPISFTSSAPSVNTVKIWNTAACNGIHMGGICGFQAVTGTDANRTTFTSCENKAALDNDGSSTDVLLIGGIVGHVNGYTTISECTNRGSIDNSGSATSSTEGDIMIGGIVGRTRHSTNMTNPCKNYGNITNSGQAAVNNTNAGLYMGGIFGFGSWGSTLNNPQNYGNLTNGCPTKQKLVCIGGINGGNSGNYSYSNSQNYGSLTNSGPAEIASIGGMAGRMGNRIYIDKNVIIGNTSDTRVIKNEAACDSLFLGGAVGLFAQGNSTKKMSFKSITVNNKFTISNTAACGRIYIGGIVAKHSEGSDTDNSEYSSCTNNAAITNSGNATGNILNIGGIIGYIDKTLTGTSSGNTNAGAISNSGTSSIICIGGNFGRCTQGNTFSSCTNTGGVSNSATASAQANIGGIAAYVSSDQSFKLTGTNSGNIEDSSSSANTYIGGICAYSDKLLFITEISSGNNTTNSGTISATTNTHGSVLMGGIVGYQKSYTSSSISGASNSGAIQCTASTTGDLEIAGVAADVAGTLENCTNSGPITIGNITVGTALYCGGVCGWHSAYKAISNLTNEATGTITMNTGTVTKLLYCGGVLGSHGKSTRTYSNFVNRGNITLGTDANQASTRINTSNTGWSCIGGCVGGVDNGNNHVTFNGLENYGNVTYFGNHRVEMGGCAGFAAGLTGTLRNVANLRFLRKPGDEANYSYLGGVVGWLEETEILSGAVCIGNVNSSGSSPKGRTAGVVAGASLTMTKMYGCKFKGDIRGSNAGYSAGLMCTSGTNNRAHEFENCVVGTGTRWYNTISETSFKTITKLVLNYNDVGSSTSTGMLCGQSHNSGTGSAAGPMTNCTIGTVE